jgi:hypothetical protein
MTDLLGSYLELSSPIEPLLAQSEPGLVRVQFREPLTDTDYARLSEWLQANPDVTLRAYGTSGSALESLDFLRWFPALTRLSIDLPGVSDLRFLEKHGENLVYLNLDSTVARIDLTRVPTRELRGLRLVNHEPGLQSLLQSNQKLRSVALWRYKAAERYFADLPTGTLESLALTRSSVGNPSAIGELDRLRLLVLRGARGFENLDFLPRLKMLEWLWLESVKLDALPSLRDNGSLVRVDLDGIRSLRADMIAALSQAQNLTELVANGGKLTPADFEILTRHRMLTAARISLGSLRRDDEVARLLAKREPSTYLDFAQSRSIDLAI